MESTRTFWSIFKIAFLSQSTQLAQMLQNWLSCFLKAGANEFCCWALLVTTLNPLDNNWKPHSESVCIDSVSLSRWSQLSQLACTQSLSQILRKSSDNCRYVLMRCFVMVGQPSSFELRALLGDAVMTFLFLLCIQDCKHVVIVADSVAINVLITMLTGTLRSEFWFPHFISDSRQFDIKICPLSNSVAISVKLYPSNI